MKDKYVQEPDHSSGKWSTDVMKNNFEKVEPEQGKRKQSSAASTNEKRIREKIREGLSVISLLWDTINWSCRYDSLFVILYNL